MIENNVAYHALLAKDPRFDGVFFVGVSSTGVYCRPICPAKTPKIENCHFYENAAAAEKDFYRPCLRCRPELAPGNAPIDDANRIAVLLTRQIEEGLIENGANLKDIASQFNLSTRQLRRIVQKELGVSPIELIQTRRLLLAKQLLTETKLPMFEVAFASGFSSLRRFNDAFSKHYRMPPSRLRKEVFKPNKTINTVDSLKLQLSYRPPYNWNQILSFLSARLIKGVESISGDSYARTVCLGRHVGWIKITKSATKHALIVELSYSLIPVLPALLQRVRNLFDLSARPDLIDAQLIKDPILKESVMQNPGYRVPGAFDGFEMSIRAILGQQITVKAATTIACRFANAFGESIDTPFAELNRLSPKIKRISTATVDEIAKCGIIRTRTNSIIALAKAIDSNELLLDVGANPKLTIKKLIALPGIGPWTAHYIAMRALRWSDAFPKEDIALCNKLGKITPKEADAYSQAWRPWRSYAVMHIWTK